MAEISPSELWDETYEKKFQLERRLAIDQHRSMRYDAETNIWYWEFLNGDSYYPDGGIFESH